MNCTESAITYLPDVPSVEILTQPLFPWQSESVQCSEQFVMFRDVLLVDSESGLASSMSDCDRCLWNAVCYSNATSALHKGPNVENWGDRSRIFGLCRPSDRADSRSQHAVVCELSIARYLLIQLPSRR